MNPIPINLHITATSITDTTIAAVNLASILQRAGAGSITFQDKGGTISNVPLPTNPDIARLQIIITQAETIAHSQAEGRLRRHKDKISIHHKGLEVGKAYADEHGQIVNIMQIGRTRIKYAILSGPGGPGTGEMDLDLAVRTLKPVIRVIFKDDGQDFLRWDIAGGVVIECHPSQGFVWCGTKVLTKKIKPGMFLKIRNKHDSKGSALLKHAVESVS